ncbi:hypothetical protein ACIA49_39055 [Kribbella sp. NPDC051587]|uniref:hypothetical protein n=1 Tax=Kribbella sp. NPDC051587 TaxID=3364119 RepID=UPI00379568C8
MTLIATRRYVQQNAQSCMERARVVRTVRRPVLKPGRRSRRPRAFLITVMGKQEPTTSPTPSAAAPGASSESTTAAEFPEGPATNPADGNQGPSWKPAPVRPLAEAQAQAYSSTRLFRICRTCGRVAPRELLVGADGPQPRHPACTPTAPMSGAEDVDA